MAGNYPFHGKLHRSAHHTLPTTGILESATDPIAGPSSKFQGVFYTQTEGSSLDWYGVYLTVQANSGYWSSVYTTVNSNSATWNLAQTLYVTVNSTSATWNLSQTTYTTVNVNSSFWSAAYTNLVSNSSNYLSGGAAKFIAVDPITNTDYFSARMQPLQLLETNVQAALSALNLRINAIYALLEGLTANRSTILVSITGS